MIQRAIIENPTMIENFDYANDYTDTVAWLKEEQIFGGRKYAGQLKEQLEDGHKQWLRSKAETTASVTVHDIQEKTEIVKRKFLALAQQFEDETGTHLSISVYHGFDKPKIDHCSVRIPTSDMQIEVPKQKEVIPV